MADTFIPVFTRAPGQYVRQRVNDRHSGGRGPSGEPRDSKTKDWLQRAGSEMGVLRREAIERSARPKKSNIRAIRSICYRALGMVRADLA